MTRLLLVSTLLASCSLWSSLAHPCPPRRRVESEYDAMVSLQRLGYLVATPGEAAELTDETWSFAVAAFQRMAAVNVTGKLDALTMDMMNKPRCGVPDVTENQREQIYGDKVSRKKRFAVAEDKWSKTELTYRITQYTPDLSEASVNSIIAQAFHKWSAVTPLTFVLRPRGPVDLELRFVGQLHGDDAPFDGAGGTLAHAFFPPTSSWASPLAGDTHFDEAETWIEINSNVPGMPLLCVAIHEIGHSLGVMHSDDEGAIMWPWAGECTANTRLGDDDISAIQHLYGSRDGDASSTASPPDEPTTLETNEPDRTSSAPEPSPHPTLPPSTDVAVTDAVTSFLVTSEETPVSTARPCDGSVDAMTNAVDGNVYGFRGNLVFRFIRGVDRGYPKLISDVFPGAPSTVTAALTSYKRHGRHHGRHGRHRHGLSRSKPEATYLFSGNQVWKYKYDRRREFRLEKHFPRLTSRVFPGVRASSIDGAVVCARSGDVYLFSGDQYWRHQGEGKRLARRSYPRPWANHPNFSSLPSVDAVLLHQERNYFFSGRNFYSYDSARRRMSGARDTARFLSWCPNGTVDESVRH